jgi:hypothetical protein
MTIIEEGSFLFVGDDGAILYLGDRTARLRHNDIVFVLASNKDQFVSVLTRHGAGIMKIWGIKAHDLVPE